MEKRNLKSYFFYATGEIVLVVIGILIALNINNWNEKQVERKSEHQYLINLLADIRLQISEYESSAHSERNAAFTIDQIGLLLASDINPVAMDSLNKLLSSFTMERSVNIFNATFDDLKSTGNIQLISNSNLKSQLLEFYQMAERADRVFIKNQNLKIKIRESLINQDLVNLDLRFHPNMIAYLSASGIEVKTPLLENGQEHNLNQIVKNNLRSKEGFLKIKNLLAARYLSSLVTLTQMNEMNAAAIELEQSLELELQSFK